MQGFNMGRYIPPDLEGSGTTGNKIHKKRAPGTLKKDGTQTVRFEMPFAIWCHTCQPHGIIGQGVRFNAEKKKVGYYHSTPIWQFRMKHAACSGWIEVRTDPKNTAYVVTEGGKARDYGDDKDKVREGEVGVPILTDAERERRRTDAFAMLEGKMEQAAVAKDSKRRVEDLYRARERDWEDTWGANKRIRESFRRERKIRKREQEKDEELQSRIGTDMKLLPETEEDARRARLVDFAAPANDLAFDEAGSKALFPTANPSPTKTQVKQSKAEALRRQLMTNTRAAMNPFNRG